MTNKKNRTSKENLAIKTTYFSILVNILVAIIKWVLGVFGNSYAIIADAIESTTDVIASVLVMLGIKYAAKPADKNHPYGHGRIEPLVTFMVVAFLVFSAALIIHDSINNIQNPHEMPKLFTLYFLGFIIIWKELCFQYVMRKSNITKSTSLRADAWHHRADAFTSLAAFIGISIANIMGEGYEHADDVAALFAAGFILYNSYHIFKPALFEIMDKDVYHDLQSEIVELSEKVDGVIKVDKCFIRKTGMRFHIDLYVNIDADIKISEGYQIANNVEKYLMEEIPEINYVMVKLKPSK